MSSQQHRHVVLLKLLIGGDEDRTVLFGLRDEQPVEGILVERREVANPPCVRGGHNERRETEGVEPRQDSATPMRTMRQA